MARSMGMQPKPTAVRTSGLFAGCITCCCGHPRDMGGSKKRGTPKSSFLIGFAIVNHPFWDTPIFGNTHIADFILILTNLDIE